MVPTGKRVEKVRMQISRTGYNRKDDPEGFTLFELVIVLFIVSLFLALVSVPIEGVLSGGDLGRATRMIMSEVSRLRGEAAYTRKSQALILNMTENTFYPYEPKDEKKAEDVLKETEQLSTEKQELPPGVSIEDVVVLSKGKQQEGEAFIRFFANGCVEHSLIHLRNSSNEAYTLEIHPVTGWVGIHEGYIEKKKEG
jgi:prepilin-type N-terminal cleavage/methylation domain-containing protein